MFTMSLADLGKYDLEKAGGKAANLGILIKAEFPVPRGFCITTRGYEAFITSYNLHQEIDSLLSSLKESHPDRINKISTRLMSLFTSRPMREIPGDEIRKAYTDYNFSYCAVRSSATAEDLPGMSFAGQQDTFLNIKGIEAFLDAVKKCWASLWTARAITYREKNQIPQTEVSIAVVVQEMIPADASGVLFTANPLTGRRSEMVIDAVYGLGEALVSGHVEPDHYVVDTQSRRITHRAIGEKKISIHGRKEGGTETQSNHNRKTRQAIGDEEIMDLIQLGIQAESVFQLPQDIEWALAGGRIYILQSRPVTSLYPLPDRLPGDRLSVFLSFGAVQGMLEPMTPLGSDVFQVIVVPLEKMIGRHVTRKTQQGLFEAGMRLFINFTHLFKSRIGRKFLEFVFPFAEPGSIKSLETLFDDPRLDVTKNFMKMRTFLGFLPVIITVVINTIRNLLFPSSARRRIQSFIDRLVSRLTEQHSAVKTLNQRLQLVESLLYAIPRFLFTRLIPAVACGQVPLQLSRRLWKNFPSGEKLVMQLTRGLPHNVTTEMDLSLWHTACLIKADERLYAFFCTRDAPALSAAYTKSEIPGPAQAAIDEFMHTYGMRGIGEIDIGKPRWKEEPEYLMRIIKSYLAIEDPEKSPASVFKNGAVSAREAASRLLSIVKQTKNGKRKSGIAAFFINRIRQLAGLRETPKFAAVQAITIQRDGLLAEGKNLVKDSIIEEPGDIFFLHLEELKEIGCGKEKKPAPAGKLQKKERDWKSLVKQRKEIYEWEKNRRKIPRILLSDGTCFYEGMTLSGGKDRDHITGSPVSPGTAEGIVHVVFDPFKEQLIPGEILVCPGTDPAWTPLFLAAAGLIMEVGGMMTHGAVVAREYGIPAIVGVDQATTRLKTGQRIRMDGSEGIAEILD
jgi:rifampicin phosphotransferase